MASFMNGIRMSRGNEHSIINDERNRAKQYGDPWNLRLKRPVLHLSRSRSEARRAVTNVIKTLLLTTAVQSYKTKGTKRKLHSLSPF
ncbi:hypothetical protein WN51_11095 [Melipona quadrifasciata]|uniref:Uncharacterized protein n=1 Tax=Melipona quadrifasciata TaxID=166423 RepID=A0A0N0BHV0_9HYME|nr:hypothetical protein WN51_11095 [Melipona quadrifasciata]